MGFLKNLWAVDRLNSPLFLRLIMQGWIKLHRELLDKPIWNGATLAQQSVLITLLLMANHKPAKWLWKGQLYECQAGQMITSIKSIQEKCHKDVTRQKVRTALEFFEKLGFLTNESTKQNRLITIVNYKTYQCVDEENNQQNNHRVTIGQPSSNHRVTTNNNVKNVNNVNNKTIGGQNKNFVPPTLQQVCDYAKEIGFDGLDCQQFIDFYSSKGWMIGKNDMKDWQAAVRTWRKRYVEQPLLTQKSKAELAFDRIVSERKQ